MLESWQVLLTIADQWKLTLSLLAPHHALERMKQLLRTKESAASIHW